VQHERPSTELMRKRILDVTTTLLAEQGYAGTSMRDIADELGVTKAALYYHFESKEHLLDAVLEEVAARFEGALEPAEAPYDPERILSASLDALIETAPILAFLMHEPAAARRHAGHPMFHALRDRLITALAGPKPSQTRGVRARCALGALQFGYIATAKAESVCSSDSTTQERKLPTFRTITATERKAIVASAVAALG
jgi:AcrR family transcriptional regulator